MLKVMFVDDEGFVLQTLERALKPVAPDWTMAFLSSGAEALARLEKERFDVIVTDMRMPGMDGAAVLETVRDRYPDMIRIVLSAYSDEGVTLKTAGTAHQYLTKPCEAAGLKSTIARAFALRGLLKSENIRQVISQIDSLPSLPMLYLELLDELKSPDASIRRAGEIIERDVAMTAKILQLANSAFFAFRHRVTSPRQAVTLLGLRTTKDLVLSVQVFAEFDHRKLREFPMQGVVDHCLATAAFARDLAKAEGAPRELADDAFMAGLLHDVGKLMLADRLPNLYSNALRAAREADLPLWQAEQETLGTTHAEIGAYLMGLWGLPDCIVECLAYHHRPQECHHTEFSPLTALHAADVLEQEDQSRPLPWGPSSLSTEYLDRLGLADRVTTWRICYRPTDEGSEQDA